MKSTLLTSAILLIGGLRASAGSLPSPPPDVVAQTVQVEHYPTTNVTLPNGVAGRPALMYSVSNGYRPLISISHPKRFRSRNTGFRWSCTSTAALGWVAIRTATVLSWISPGVLASLSQRGYVVASIEYRLSGEAKFPAPIQDVKRRFAGCGCALPLLNTQSTPRER
jgi:hypothetical protein